MFVVFVVLKTELTYSCKPVILVSRTTEYRQENQIYTASRNENNWSLSSLPEWL